MTNQDDTFKSNIQNELNLFFEKLDFKIKDLIITLIENDSNNISLIKIDLTVDNPEILIGEGGDTLVKLQHILKMVLRKKTIPASPYFYLNLDINNYKSKKEDYLKGFLEKLVKEIILNGQEKLLEVMPSYERKIIHIALKDNKNVITESIGQGNEKRVLIKLKNPNHET